VALPRPAGRRGTSRARDERRAHLRRRARRDGVCERAVDVCWRVFGSAGDVECVLEIRLSLH
jgi:hypothetical protein